MMTPASDETRDRSGGLLIDLSGVVYQGASPIDGSAEAIGRLRAEGLPFRFLTNTTSKPHGEIVEKLRALGIDAADEEVFTPVVCARRYLAEHDLSPHLLVAPSLEAEFRDLPADRAPAVVVGDAGDLSPYETR